MEGNNSPKVSAWGAPALGAQVPQASSRHSTPENPHVNQSSSGKTTPGHQQRFQRPGPYSNSPRGRNLQNSGGPTQNRNQNDSPGLLDSPGQNFNPANPYLSQGQSFSSDNPYQNQGQKFSAGNPFQNKSPGQIFRPENPFQNSGQNSSSNTPFQESGSFNSPNRFPNSRPRFQSSPYSRSPARGNANFSPRTPSGNFRTSSPIGFTPGSGRGFHPNSRGNFNSSKRPYNQQNRGMSNPGGSDNIRDYIHPSMLEDPWKDLPATPMLQSY